MIRPGSKLGRAFVLVSRLAIGAMLLWTAIPKLLRPDEFLVHVQGYGVLSTGTAPFFAAALPGIEIITGFCLIVGLAARGAFLAAAGTFAMFVGAIAMALVRGLSIDCGCGLFGGSEQITRLTLLRSLLLLLWALLAYILAARIARQRSEASAEQSVLAHPPVEAPL